MRKKISTSVPAPISVGEDVEGEEGGEEDGNGDCADDGVAPEKGELGAKGGTRGDGVGVAGGGDAIGDGVVEEDADGDDDEGDGVEMTALHADEEGDSVEIIPPFRADEEGDGNIEEPPAGERGGGVGDAHGASASKFNSTLASQPSFWRSLAWEGKKNPL